MPDYSVEENFNHTKPPKIGILITNLGTPDAPTPSALKRYLREFLSDPRIVEIPRFLWWIILNAIVLNVRPRKSAHTYQKIWTDSGSPLLSITQKQYQALAKILVTNTDRYVLSFGMRYGKPNISEALEELRNQGAEYLLILPLYPQYAGATVGSTFDSIANTLKTWRWVPELRFVSHYHDTPEYIEACVMQIKQFWQSHEPPEKLILSYHGLPKRQLTAGDPYYYHCQKTSKLITETLKLPDDQVLTCFQSRFGKQEWLKPYLDETLKILAKQKLKSIHIFCPGFSADCLETLEEINIQNQTLYKEAGGGEFHYIPALNDSPHHIQALVKIIEKNLTGWN